MPGPMRPGGIRAKVSPPSGIKDVPRYLRELIGGFFVRFLYIVRLVWDTGHWILFAMSFMALMNGIIPVLTQLASRGILNSLQLTLTDDSGGSFWQSKILTWLIIYFSIVTYQRISDNINNAINRIAGEQIVRTVKTRIMEKSKEIDLASFDSPAFYEKLENANREAGNRPITVLSQMFQIISVIIQIVGFIIVMASAPGMWWSVLLVAAVSIPAAIINFVYRRKNFEYTFRRSKDRRQMSYYSDLLVNKDLVKEVRMFDLSDTLIGRFQRVFEIYYKGLIKLIRDENIWHAVISLISSGSMLILYLLITMMVFGKRIMIGDYSLYTGAISSISSCIGYLITMSAHIYEGTLFIDNLIAYMSERPTVVPRLSTPRRVNHGGEHTIEFRNVYFRYPGTDRDVLKDVSLTLRPGETMVLVGLNGAGKTTFLKLLTRLYDPTAGEIYLDGYDLREYDVKDLYSMFGIIFQDFGKYAFTIGENIHFGNIHKEYSEEDVVRAARESNAIEYISRLPMGLDTPLMRWFEPEATDLSIGQWQKLAISRAFYSDSDVLILDEPTASLDPIAEQEIFNQFDRLRQSKTTIFVSHRLSSATIASLIVVLEDGMVEETGTHAELMEKKGKYYTLFSTQAKRYIQDPAIAGEEQPPVGRDGGHRPENGMNGLHTAPEAGMTV